MPANGGCATSESRWLQTQVSQLALPEADAWIYEILDDKSGVRIMTVHCDPHWQSYFVRDRWMTEGHVYLRDYQWGSEENEHNKCVTTLSADTKNHTAIQLFARLFSWTTQSNYAYEPHDAGVPFVLVLATGNGRRAFKASSVGFTVLDALQEDEWMCWSCESGMRTDCDDKTCRDVYCNMSVRAFDDPSVFFLQALSYLDILIESNCTEGQEKVSG